MTTVPSIQLIFASLLGRHAAAKASHQVERDLVSLQNALFLAFTAFSFILFGQGAILIMLLYKVIFSLASKAFRLS